MFKKIIINVLLSIVLIGCDDKNSAQQVLKVATSGDNPPYEFYEKGQLTGFDIELMKKLAAQLGKTVEFVDMDFGGIIAAIQSGRVDAAIAAFTPTKEREKSVDFSDTYYKSVPAFIVLKNTPAISLDDLKDKALGVQMGATHEKVAQKIHERMPTLKVVTLNKIPDLVQALKAHHVDAILIGSTEAQAMVQGDSELSMQETRDLPEVHMGDAIVLPKGSSLKEPINKALQVLQKDNTVSTLKKQWGLK